MCVWMSFSVVFAQSCVVVIETHTDCDSDTVLGALATPPSLCLATTTQSPSPREQDSPAGSDALTTVLATESSWCNQPAAPLATSSVATTVTLPGNVNVQLDHSPSPAAVCGTKTPEGEPWASLEDTDPDSYYPLLTSAAAAQMLSNTTERDPCGEMLGE